MWGNSLDHFPTSLFINSRTRSDILYAQIKLHTLFAMIWLESRIKYEQIGTCPLFKTYMLGKLHESSFQQKKIVPKLKFFTRRYNGNSEQETSWQPCTKSCVSVVQQKPCIHLSILKPQLQLIMHVLDLPFNWFSSPYISLLVK